MTRRPRRLPGVLLAAALLAPALSACTEVGAAGDKGYVTGTGAVDIVPAAERRAPGKVAGETIDGEPISLADFEGSIVVIPIWGSWCPPCRKEAPMLAAAARDLERRGVEFMGIDSRDPDRAQARAFVRNFRIPYPSIYDTDGVTMLAFRDSLAPNSIPSVLFVDEQGRVAAVVRGEIDRSTLYGIVEDLQPAGDAAGKADGT